MHKQPEDPARPREIRRYANRRLYDTVERRCITHAELRGLVHSGAELRILDYETGRDITVDVLAQVAHREVAGWRDRRAGPELYREIIEDNRISMGMKAINNIILAGLGAVSLTRDKAEEIIDQLIKRGEVSRKDRKAAIDDLITRAEEHGRKFADTMKNQAAKLRGVRREEYDELAEEVENLRAEVARLKEKSAG